jgi:hypothetical protein
MGTEKVLGASDESARRPEGEVWFLAAFMYFAAVCDRDVISIGSAIVASQGT